MHHEVNYTKLPEEEKSTKALEDIRDWLGEDKFDEITRYAREEYPEPMHPRAFAFYISLAGIEGFPVEVWHKYIWSTSNVEEG